MRSRPQFTTHPQRDTTLFSSRSALGKDSDQPSRLGAPLYATYPLQRTLRFPTHPVQG